MLWLQDNKTSSKLLQPVIWKRTHGTTSCMLAESLGVRWSLVPTWCEIQQCNICQTRWPWLSDTAVIFQIDCVNLSLNMPVRWL